MTGPDPSQRCPTTRQEEMVTNSNARNIRKLFFTGRTIKHSNTLPREAGGARAATYTKVLF